MSDSGHGLTVLHVVLSLDTGGTERLVVDMANRLTHEGARVHVCCLDAIGALAAGLDDRVSVHLIARPPRFSAAVAWRLAALARRVGATVLHCHQYTPFVYGCASRAFMPTLRMVFTEHGRLVGAVPSSRRRRVNRCLTRIGGRQFAVSEELRAYMVEEGFSPKRLDVIHNGIEPRPAPTCEDRAAARRRLGLHDSHFVVGTSARFDPVKDLTTLVEAAALARQTLPTLKLLMIGGGACRAEIEQHAAALGLGDLVLPGYIADARSLLPAFDVYVNCSLSEGISVAVLEAMDAAVAVVATRVGGTPEIVRNEVDGWLVPAQAPRALADAIAFVGTHTDARRAAAEQARRRVQESFTAAGMVGRYLDAYCDNRRAPGPAATNRG